MQFSDHVKSVSRRIDGAESGGIRFRLGWGGASVVRLVGEDLRSRVVAEKKEIDDKKK